MIYTFFKFLIRTLEALSNPQNYKMFEVFRSRSQVQLRSFAFFGSFLIKNIEKMPESNDHED